MRPVELIEKARIQGRSALNEAESKELLRPAVDPSEVLALIDK